MRIRLLPTLAAALCAAVLLLFAGLAPAEAATATSGNTPAGGTVSTPSGGVAPSGGAALANSAAAAAATPNGCSFSPDRWGKANFKPTCNLHDICYSATSVTNRVDCDNAFRTRLIGECRRAYPTDAAGRATCTGVANIYYGAVRAAGSAFYKGRGLNN